MSTSIVPWASISLLHNVVKTLDLLKKRDQQQLPIITYKSKIKLHGTNCAVQRTKGGIFPQSRTVMLSLQSDNKGFARWVAENEGYFQSLPVGTTLFGEWCGTGVEKGVAVSAIGRKIFAVFAIQQGVNDEAILEVEPSRIEQLLSKHPDIFVLPWFGGSTTLDYASDLTAVIDKLNSIVETVEKEDPWVKASFDISGVGEGIVLYPMLEAAITPELFSLYAFKAKGDKHRVVATKKAVQISPEIVENANAFVLLTATKNRLSQGVKEACDDEFNLKYMGQFLKWVDSDIKKECQDELAASNLTWKQVMKPLSNYIRQWYMDECKKLKN